jgi:hypothetical protein
MNQNYNKILLLFYNQRISAVHDRIAQTGRNGFLTLLLALVVQVSFAQEKQFPERFQILLAHSQELQFLLKELKLVRKQILMVITL